MEDSVYIFDDIRSKATTEARRNVVIANAAMAIKVVGGGKPMSECLALARESLESGRAKEVLKRYVELNS